jgi:hypothetical protein
MMLEHEPLLFKPFKELKETFSRDEYPGGCFFQKAISVSPVIASEIDIRFADETNRGSSGNVVRLTPKQVIVLKDLLSQIEVDQNPDFKVKPFHSDNKKQTEIK